MFLAFRYFDVDKLYVLLFSFICVRGLNPIQAGFVLSSSIRLKLLFACVERNIIIKFPFFVSLCVSLQ